MCGDALPSSHAVHQLWKANISCPSDDKTQISPYLITVMLSLPQKKGLFMSKNETRGCNTISCSVYLTVRTYPGTGCCKKERSDDLQNFVPTSKQPICCNRAILKLIGYASVPNWRCQGCSVNPCVRLAVYRSVKALFNSSNGTNRHHKRIMLQNAIDIEPLHIMKQGNNKPLSVAWKEYVILDQLCL